MVNLFLITSANLEKLDETFFSLLLSVQNWNQKSYDFVACARSAPWAMVKVDYKTFQSLKLYFIKKRLLKLISSSSSLQIQPS